MQYKGWHYANPIFFAIAEIVTNCNGLANFGFFQKLLCV